MEKVCNIRSLYTLIKTYRQTAGSAFPSTQLLASLFFSTILTHSKEGVIACVNRTCHLWPNIHL